MGEYGLRCFQDLACASAVRFKDPRKIATTDYVLDMALISWLEPSTTLSRHPILSSARHYQQPRSHTPLHRIWSFNHSPDQSSSLACHLSRKHPSRSKMCSIGGHPLTPLLYAHPRVACVFFWLKIMRYVISRPDRRLPPVLQAISSV